MLRIAITGGIACGKSRVGALLAERDVAICEADELAHGVMKLGGAVHNDVVREFGREILGENGEMDRRQLADIVFSDFGKLAVLNAIVHPAVKRAWQSWLVERDRNSVAVAVIVPLLFEANEGKDWDAIVCVSASQAVQMRRLAERKITGVDAERRLSAQMPLAKKIELSDYVIHNDESEELLREQTVRVMNRIMGE